MNMLLNVTVLIALRNVGAWASSRFRGSATVSERRALSPFSEMRKVPKPLSSASSKRASRVTEHRVTPVKQAP